MTKRVYIRCRTECSLPPMYMSTGSHLRVRSGSKAASPQPALGYRRKYHAESRKLSLTSVSRRAGCPQLGHGARTKSSQRASGLEPEPSGLNSSTWGSRTGRSSSGTGTVPQDSQWMMGMGGPQ